MQDEARSGEILAPRRPGACGSPTLSLKEDSMSRKVSDETYGRKSPRLPMSPPQEPKLDLKVDTQEVDSGVGGGEPPSPVVRED
jgi:hypothetical protein